MFSYLFTGKAQPERTKGPLLLLIPSYFFAKIQRIIEKSEILPIKMLFYEKKHYLCTYKIIKLWTKVSLVC